MLSTRRCNLTIKFENVLILQKPGKDRKTKCSAGFEGVSEVVKFSN